MNFKDQNELTNFIKSNCPDIWSYSINLPFQSRYNKYPNELLLLCDKSKLNNYKANLNKLFKTINKQSWHFDINGTENIFVSLNDFDNPIAKNKIALKIASINYPENKSSTAEGILFPWKINNVHLDSTNTKEQLHSLGIRNFKRFVSTIYKLNCIEDQNFDLILGSGTSGLSMTKFTEMTYNKLGLPIPKIINLPLTRTGETVFKDGKFVREYYNIEEILVKVKNELSELPQIKNILVVDEEIGYGLTIKTVLTHLIDQIPNLSETIKVTVIAESYGNEVESEDERYTIRLCPISIGNPDLDCAIYRIIPMKTQKLIGFDLAGRKLNIKELTNILLDLPLKTLEYNNSKFTYKYNLLADMEIKKLVEHKKTYQRLIESYIDETLKEIFRFNNSRD